MAKGSNEMDEAKRDYLDTCGFAQLSTQAPRVEISAMATMYNRFLSERDPFIANALSQAELSKLQIQTKQQYDTASKEQKEKHNLKNPGQPDANLAQSLQSLRGAADLYTGKRQELIYEMTPSQMLGYNSNPDGTPIVTMPDNVKNLLTSSNQAIGKIKDRNVSAAILSLDGYKIHGLLNSIVENEIAQRNLEAISAELQTNAKKKK
jgi:hypothetical protein